VSSDTQKFEELFTKRVATYAGKKLENTISRCQKKRRCSLVQRKL